MNKGELVAAVAEASGLSRGEATRAVESTFRVITGELTEGREVKVVGFGSFVPGEKAAGMGRNPKTGEPVSVPASKTVRFRAGGRLKDVLNTN